MSGRLGAALARRILDLPGERKFVLVEGVEEDLAVALAQAWGDAPLRLAVASVNPDRFGARALAHQSGTALRNEGPVCLVVCEGAQLPDRQSLRAFESVAPSDLLTDHAGLSLLALQEPRAEVDGPARPVRGAIIQAGAAARPSAPAVAEYFDRCAAGEPPLRALPALGAFADHAAGDRVDERRVLENLKLAARLRTEQPGRPADVRRRAQRVLSQRPGLSAADAKALAERAVVMLQSGSNEILSTLTYDEASEILEQKTSDLSTAVGKELQHYKQTHEADDQDIAWERYEDAARQLRNEDEQKDAARDLLNFDVIQNGEVFEPGTRRRLEQLLKDRVLTASHPSCPELALLRAAVGLGGIGKVELLAPLRAPDSRSRNRTAASQEIVLACCRMRLGELFHDFEEEGVEIDGALLLPAGAEWPDIFQDAQLDTGPPLTTIQLRIRARDSSDSRIISWRPDLDDIAALRSAIALAEQPALSLRVRGTPSLEAFCSGPPPEPEPVPPELGDLARALQVAAQEALAGLRPETLNTWAAKWTATAGAEEEDRRTAHTEQLALAGAAVSDSACALTPFAPLKAEWLAQYLDALWSMLWLVQQAHGERAYEPGEETAVGVARSTAAHYPAHLRLPTRDKPLLPTGEGRIWSVYGADMPDSGQLAGEALGAVIERLLRLQPDAAGHLRCLAYGPGAGTLLVEQAIALIGRRVGRAVLRKLELFCIEEGGGKPSAQALANADEAFAGEADRPFELRYLATLDDALAIRAQLSPDAPIVHLALVTGLSGGGSRARLNINTPEIDLPPVNGEALFAPRTWTRAKQQRRLLLAPPATTAAGGLWLRLMNAVEDDWPELGGPVRVPELQTASREIRSQLLASHDLALWVATLDPYASRDSLTHALGEQVAILHQDRRLGGDSPLSLVISQKSGGPVDRAVARTLRSARIVEDFTAAREIGESLRKVASEGYGVLALEAATTGAGINELVGHVVAFSLLATHTTPWPLPPDCRVLLVSLDDYKHWFPSKRADLLVFALDTAEGGVHVAAIEVKARRSDADLAARDALDQLRQTLHATRFAAYPEHGSVHSRLWLNRLAEAACAVARESNFRLDERELAALENFRLGRGTLEWAGLGLVFGPSQSEFNRHYHQEIAGDRIPIVVHSVRLTEQLLRAAAGVELTTLRTVDAERPPLEGGRVRRRPERGASPDEPPEEPQEPAGPPLPTPIQPGGASAPDPMAREPATDEPPAVATSEAEPEPTAQRAEQSPEAADGEPATANFAFEPPVLGWDASTGEPLLWRAAGPDAALDNGHTEIWGASGAGKTQFTMSLLAQLAAHTGARFGIADFKNDYSNDGEDRFPERVGARFINLWNPGAPFNPLALESADEWEVNRAIIEMRDIVDVATQSFMRMGHRQKDKLQRALESVYDIGRQEGRWPTLRTLNDQLDDDLRAVIGDLTRYPIFRDGPPLGQATEENLVFGLYDIPGSGLTTVLAAGFILSALHLRIQSFPQAANTIRYVLVVDEAHRVAAFKAVKSMLREGRSKGLAVVLATQQPGDLPEEVATNANTRVCFRLPDATIAAAAARRLDATDRSLAEQIRTLDRGEAFVSLAGSPPQLLRMAQFWRDRGALQLPD